MSPVIVHLPHGYPRTLRHNDAPLLSHLGYRVWQALLAKLCLPTCRAVAERFEVNKDTAARALRSLIASGLLHRRRRSAGRRIWAWCYVVTDEPHAWLDDTGLTDKVDRAHEHEIARLRSLHDRYDNDTPGVSPDGPPVPPSETPPHEPPPERGYPQQSQVVSCPNSSDIPKKISSQEISPPTPSPVDRVVHRLSRYERRLAELVGRRELEPYVPHALALLHGLGFPPLARVRHARVIAEALRSGRTLGSLTTFLTCAMDSARNPRAVLAHRLAKLAATLDRERHPHQYMQPNRRLV